MNNRVSEDLMWAIIKETTGCESAWELKEELVGSASIESGVFKVEINLTATIDKSGVKMYYGKTKCAKKKLLF